MRWPKADDGQEGESENNAFLFNQLKKTLGAAVPTMMLG